MPSSRYGLAGTTSACAENTSGTARQPGRARNYLRVRGEYRTVTTFIARNVELPPRARRILVDGGAKDTILGTTSACAENTATGVTAGFNIGNYLRVRGEYLNSRYRAPRRQELPPRARRIR